MENLSQNYLYKANADFPVLFDSDPAEWIGSAALH